MGYRVGLDIGGTTVGIGFVNNENQIVVKDSIPTRDGKVKLEGRELADRICKKLISFGKEIDSIGIGVPGTVDTKTGSIIYANNLDFTNVPFSSYIKENINVPVAIDNDANVAAWAEYKAGAGKDKKLESFIMVTLGTGVGAGYVFNDRLFSGCNMGAGEIGHMVIDMHGRKCNCGRRGCFESYASASALMADAVEAMEEDKGSLLLELCPDKNMNGKIFFEALSKNDKTAKKVFNEYMTYLSVGILNIINALQPDMLAIGGGISAQGEVIMKPLRESIKDLVYTKDSKVQTSLEIAKLGNEAGILGAALLKNMI